MQFIRSNYLQSAEGDSEKNVCLFLNSTMVTFVLLFHLKSCTLLARHRQLYNLSINMPL